MGELSRKLPRGEEGKEGGRVRKKKLITMGSVTQAQGPALSGGPASAHGLHVHQPLHPQQQSTEGRGCRPPVQRRRGRRPREYAQLPSGRTVNKGH